MHVISFSLHSQCFKLYYRICYVFLSLLECLNLLFSICCFVLITKCYLQFLDKVIPILNIVFFFYLVDFLLHINFCYISLSQASTVVTLSFIAVTLLLLRNNQIPLHQSSNFITIKLFWDQDFTPWCNCLYYFYLYY